MSHGYIKSSSQSKKNVWINVNRMEYDKLAVNNEVYSWSEALGEVVDPRGARVLPVRDGSVSPQR